MNGTLWMQLLLELCTILFETCVFVMVWRYSCILNILIYFWNYLFFFFTFFLLFELCNFSCSNVYTTPLTVVGESFWNFARVYVIIWRYACAFDIFLNLFMPGWSPAYLFVVVFVKCVCIWRTSVFFQFYGVLSGVIYNYSPHFFFIIQSHTFAAENYAIGNIVK